MSKKNVAPSENYYKVYDCNKDLSQKWFVHYTHEKKRVKIYTMKEHGININAHDTAADRLVAANLIIKYLKGEYVKPFEIEKLVSDMLLGIEMRIISKKSKQCMGAYVHTFAAYLEESAINSMQMFDKEHFIYWLKNKRELHNSTINHYIGKLKSIFKQIIKNGNWQQENPFSEVSRLKSSATSAKYFTRQDLTRLKPYLDKHQELNMYVQFMYYCFIRPNELRQMKVSDINLEEKKIQVRSKISKNEKAQYIVIPMPFYGQVLAFLDGKVNSDYLFSGKNGKMLYINAMYNKFRKLLSAAGFDITQYSIYSMKHTGAVQAVLNGIDVKSLQIQLRHSSLDITDQYLKQIGIQDLVNLRDNFPSF
jgi:site-specific recombinase XerD